MTYQLLAGPTIAAGQSLSNALDTSAGAIIRLRMPSAWDGANLSFQVSSDGTTWSDAFTIDGREALIPVVAGSTVVVALADGSPPPTVQAQPPDWRGATWIKVRSGSRAYPVVQTAQRDFAVTIDVP